MLFFAGIWEGSVETGFCTAILTEPAATNLQHIHSRQPVVLDPGCRYEWLDTGITERDQIKQVTRRLNPELLTSWAVTPAMNRPDYDEAFIIEPIEWTEGSCADKHCSANLVASTHADLDHRFLRAIVGHQTRRNRAFLGGAQECPKNDR